MAGALFLVSLPAFAQVPPAPPAAPASPSSDPVADARAHFSEGVRRFGEGDFEGARRMFLEAEREHHAPVIVYNLARAEERLGHPQAAVDAYERYLAEVGATADFAQSAAVAVADLRARSSRVRIESQPPGARIFVDGNPLPEATPTTVLLSSGTHHVVVEGDTWRAANDFEAAAGSQQTVSLLRPDTPTPPPTVTLPPPKPPPVIAPLPPVTPVVHAGPSDLVFGASFVVIPFAFLGARSPTTLEDANKQPILSSTGQTITNGSTIFGGEAGLTAEVGYAFTPRAEILLRGLVAIGSTCGTAFQSHIASAGPAISYRLTDNFWIGGSVQGGSGATCRETTDAPVYNTTLVLSTTLDVEYAVASQPYGQWVITAGIASMFADMKNENPLIYAPIGFGVRFY